MNKQQEPRLRFKGFTGTWEEKKVIDFSPLQRGFDLPVSKITEGDYPVVFSNGILKSHNQYKVKGVGIVTGRSGTIGEVTFVEKDFWPHNTALWVTNFFGNNPQFVFHFLKNFDLSRFATGSGVPTLNRNDVHNQTIYVPKFEEQTYLGNFFRRLDSQIAESRAVLEKSRQLKKAMLAKMFPANGEKIPKIRFKGFEGEWECRKLGDVVEIVGGYAFKSAEFGSGNMAIIRISNILPNGSIGGDFVYFGEDENLEKFKANKNDYLIAMSGATTGKIGQVRHEAYINQRVGLFRQNENSNNDFIGSLLQKEEFLTYLMENWGAGAQPNISIKQMENYNTYFPNLKEQTAIGNFFRQLDETIALQSAEVEKLNQLKKGLLAAMLV